MCPGCVPSAIRAERVSSQTRSPGVIDSRVISVPGSPLGDPLDGPYAVTGQREARGVEVELLRQVVRHHENVVRPGDSTGGHRGIPGADGSSWTISAHKWTQA